MAKKRTGSMVGDEVEPGPGAYEPLSDEELGKSRSSGVTLKDGEWAELERIASEHGWPATQLPPGLSETSSRATGRARSSCPSNHRPLTLWNNPKHCTNNPVYYAQPPIPRLTRTVFMLFSDYLNTSSQVGGTR